MSITAVSGATLAKDRVLSLEDLGHNLTGISFTANSPQANEINIRGVVNTRLTSPTADQSVSTFVDDVYVSRSGNLNSSFYDIARIEVVRGPQGVLLGKNVAGGAVNIISNEPSSAESGRFTVTAGNYDNVAVGSKACLASGCTSAELAVADMTEWSEDIAGQLPGGSGVVCVDSGYEIMGM